ncbi:MAG: cytochrome c oxidase subunit 3 [Acidobacteriia bacterium]|nr:cytochrome c oxidase subunit 3 [Terriglobia bacterium]
MSTQANTMTAAGKSGAAEAAKSGIWVGIAAITMSFAAFTSAIIVRQGSDASWQHLALPPVLYLTTLILLGSSVTLEMSRRGISALTAGSASGEGGEAAAGGLRWLGGTLGLGLLFVAGQYVAWQQLAAQGIFLATNPSSSFFYVLTAMHGLHVLGGLAALGYVLRKLAGARPALRRSAYEAVCVYWHFMGGLWVYLLLVMRMRL